MKYSLALLLSLYIFNVQSQEQIPDSLIAYSEPFRSSYHFLSFNDYNPGKGSITYQNIWLFYNQISYGLTDNITLNGGLIINGDFFWIGGKVGYPIIKDRINIGFASRIFVGDGEPVIFNTGQVTFGPRKANLSVGISFGNRSPRSRLSLKGMLIIGKRFYFFTENYIDPREISGEKEVDDLISITGGRIVADKRGSGFEIGVIVLPTLPFSDDDDGIATLPFLGITVPLNKRK